LGLRGFLRRHDVPNSILLRWCGRRRRTWWKGFCRAAPQIDATVAGRPSAEGWLKESNSGVVLVSPLIPLVSNAIGALGLAFCSMRALFHLRIWSRGAESFCSHGGASLVRLRSFYCSYLCSVIVCSSSIHVRFSFMQRSNVRVLTLLGIR
jgi:hypothetical protein